MKKKNIQLCICLDKETKERLLLLADQNRISLAQQIRNLIWEAKIDDKKDPDFIYEEGEYC